MFKSTRFDKNPVPYPHWHLFHKIRVINVKCKQKTSNVAHSWYLPTVLVIYRYYPLLWCYWKVKIWYLRLYLLRTHVELGAHTCCVPFIRPAVQVRFNADPNIRRAFCHRCYQPEVSYLHLSIWWEEDIWRLKPKNSWWLNSKTCCHHHSTFVIIYIEYRLAYQQLSVNLLWRLSKSVEWISIHTSPVWGVGGGS